jgi:phosphonate transport system substrate-binding protein
VSRLARAAVSGLAALTLLLAGCGGNTSDAASPTCPDGRIRFGVEPFEDPARLTPAYQVLADALSQRLGCPVDLQVVEDYSAEVLAMQNGRLDVAQFGPLGYVFASERAHAEPVASFADATGALSTYTAGIWVPADSPITDVAGLRGRSLALSSAGSTSGDALPRKALADAGLAEADVRIDYAGGHPEALLALVNGTVDAAEINSQQLRSATDAGTFDTAGFRQIWTSEPIPNDPITVRGDLDPAVKAAVRDALLGLTPEQVAQVGALLDVSPPGPLVPVERATYQPLFDLAAALGLTEEDV